MSSTVRVQAETLESSYQAIFQAIGCSAVDAGRMASALVAADLRGLETHGAWRVPQYVRLAEQGLINVRPAIRISRTAPSTAVVDGGDGFGQVVAQVALDTAMELARTQGAAAVTAGCTNHVGSLYYFARQAAEQGFIAFLVTNSPPNMAPWGGAQAVLGTNPLCIAAPVADGPPVILDMATSVVAKAKILVAEKTGRPIPEGWALDPNGRPTTDAGQAAAGTVLPVGGAKGYGLAVMVDILAGVLAGAGFGTGAYYARAPKEGGLGFFCSLYAVDRFMEPEAFAGRMAAFAGMLKASPLAPGAEPITLPGERSAATEERMRREGVTLSAEVFADLQQVARRLGITVDW